MLTELKSYFFGIFFPIMKKLILAVFPIPSFSSFHWVYSIFCSGFHKYEINIRVYQRHFTL